LGSCPSSDSTKDVALSGRDERENMLSVGEGDGEMAGESGDDVRRYIAARRSGDGLESGVQNAVEGEFEAKLSWLRGRSKWPGIWKARSRLLSKDVAFISQKRGAVGTGPV
jgi:hypothetical protein